MWDSLPKSVVDERCLHDSEEITCTESSKRQKTRRRTVLYIFAHFLLFPRQFYIVLTGDNELLRPLVRTNAFVHKSPDFSFSDFSQKGVKN